MTKTVTFILIITLTVLMIGCSSKDSSIDEANALTESLAASEDIELDHGTIKTTGEITTLTFEREEVTDGVFMEKKVEFTETDDGFDGIITLAFDGEGDYAHIETIPKSFAAHVDDLEFSIEPDEIINPDPVVKWEITKSQEIIKEITIRAGEAAGKKDTLSATIIAFGTEKMKSNVVFSDEAQAAALGTFLSSANDFAFIKGLQKCQAMPLKTEKEYSEHNGCLIRLLIEWPEKFSSKDCEDMDFKSYLIKNTCLAVVTGKSDYCKMDRLRMDKELKAESEQSCKYIMAGSFVRKCAEQNEMCKIGAAMWSNNPVMCDSLPSFYPKMCQAFVYQNDVYCQEMDNTIARKTCCSTVNSNQEDIDECALDDEEPKAVEADLPPLPAWMDCPIPEGTHVRSWNQAQTSGYEYLNEENKKYGPYVNYMNKDYEFPYQFYCYDEDGKKHGKFQEYKQRTNLLTIEGSYYYGQYDGVIKKYSGEHLIELTTYDQGIKDGYAEEYQYNGEYVGTLKKKGNYVTGWRDGEWEAYDDEGKRTGTIVYENKGATSHFIPIGE